MVSGSAGVSPAVVGVPLTTFLLDSGLGETPSPATGTVALHETLLACPETHYLKGVIIEVE